MHRLRDNLAPLAIGIGAILLGTALFFTAGCRTKTASTFKYDQQGRLAEAAYTQDSGFSFFSEGANKTLSPSLNVNGVSF